MPTLIAKTNGGRTPTDQELATLTTSLAAALGKSADYIQIIVEAPAVISFAGKTEPTAWLALHSIGLTPEVAQNCVPVLTDWVRGGLGVPPARAYLNFQDVAPERCAWQGKTFA